MQPERLDHPSMFSSEVSTGTAPPLNTVQGMNCGVSSSWRHFGAAVFHRDWKATNRILKVMWRFTGSQCSSCRIGVVWLSLLLQMTIHAAYSEWFESAAVPLSNTVQWDVAIVQFGQHQATDKCLCQILCKCFWILLMQCRWKLQDRLTAWHVAT